MNNSYHLLTKIQIRIIAFRFNSAFIYWHFLQDLTFYRNIIWPINMVIVGIASVGVFIEKGKWKNIIRNFLFILVVALPIGLPFLRAPALLLLGIKYRLRYNFLFSSLQK